LVTFVFVKILPFARRTFKFSYRHNEPFHIISNSIEIWKYAKENGFIIIAKDDDFINLIDMKRFPPKVVLLKTGNSSSKALM